MTELGFEISSLVLSYYAISQRFHKVRELEEEIEVLLFNLMLHSENHLPDISERFLFMLCLSVLSNKVLDDPMRQPLQLFVNSLRELSNFKQKPAYLFLLYWSSGFLGIQSKFRSFFNRTPLYYWKATTSFFLSQQFQFFLNGDSSS